MAFDMGSLLRPGKVALLLSEVQRGIIGDLTEGPLAKIAAQVGVIDASARLAKAARAHGAPVIHCLANTTAGRFGANTNARLFKSGTGGKRPESLPPKGPDDDMPCQQVYEEGDVLSPRDHGLNPMADSSLDRRLRNAGVQTLIVAGVSLNVAIPNMVMEAVNSGYQVIVASDAVSGFPHEYGLEVMKNTLFLISTLATVDDIIAAWPA